MALIKPRPVPKSNYHFRSSGISRSGRFQLIGIGALDRTGILSLGIDIAVDQFDDRDRRRVRSADAGLDHAGVTAVAVLVALGQDFEQLGELRVVLQAGMGQTTVRQATLLGEGDQLLDVRTQFLRLGRGRQDLLMLDERGGEVAEQRVAMPGAALQLAMTNLVTQFSSFVR